MGKLEGKVALITGGTSGIGLATAKLFLAEGAQLIVTGRNPQRILETQEALGANALVVRSEAGSLADIEFLMTQIGARYGRLDVLVLNAAVLQTGVFDSVGPGEFDEVMNANIKGPFFTIQKALPLLASQSSVIAITSIAQNKGMPNSIVYAASKAALRSFVRSFAVALIGRGIRVNSVSPGPISTEGFDEMGLPATTVDAMQIRSPIKRFGFPDEVAKAMLFLASDESSYIVGEEIVVDGGITLV